MEYHLPILSVLLKSDLQLEGVCSCGSTAEVAKSQALLLSLDEVTDSCGTHVGCIESLANAQCREINIMMGHGNCLSKLYVSVKKLSPTPFPVLLVLQHEWLSST